MMLLHRIERFLRQSDMPPTRFGRLAVKDPRLVGDMRNGRQPSPRMIARVDAFITAHKVEPGA